MEVLKGRRVLELRPEGVHKGRVAETGNHSSLMATNGAYAALMQEQVRESEPCYSTMKKRKSWPTRS